MCGISHYGFNTTIPGGFLAGPSIVTWGVYTHTHTHIDKTNMVTLKANIRVGVFRMT